MPQVTVEGIVGRFGMSQKKGTAYITIRMKRKDGQDDEFTVFPKSLDGVVYGKPYKATVNVRDRIGWEV